jgi:hypothetical protein
MPIVKRFLSNFLSLRLYHTSYIFHFKCCLETTKEMCGFLHSFSLFIALPYQLWWLSVNFITSRISFSLTLATRASHFFGQIIGKEINFISFLYKQQQQQQERQKHTHIRYEWIYNCKLSLLSLENLRAMYLKKSFTESREK